MSEIAPAARASRRTVDYPWAEPNTRNLGTLRGHQLDHLRVAGLVHRPMLPRRKDPR